MGDARGGAGVKRERTFSLSVVSQGFEASCIAEDGALCFQHRNFGVRVEKRRSVAVEKSPSPLRSQ